MSEASPPDAVRRADMEPAHAAATTRTDLFVWLGALAIALTAVAIFGADHAGSLYDDAYIYFRYADHVLAGCGLRWNCGDAPVEGFSGPAYLALLTGLRALGVELERAAALVGGLSTIAAIVLACGIVWRATRSAAAALAAALVLAADHGFLLNAVTGMETALAAAAVTLYGWCALGGDRGTGAVAIAALLCRPEAALLLGVLPLDRRRWRRPRTARAIVGLGLALAAIVAARWLVFHDWLPNTYWAKAGGSAAHVRLGLAYLEETLVTFPVLALAPLALLRRELRAAVAPILVAELLWMLAFIRTGGDHFGYGRLAAPLVPLCTALAAIGLVELVRRATSLRAPLAAVTLCGLAAWAHLTHSLAPQHGFDNVLRWKLVGQWLREHRPGYKLATVPIGAIGWFSDAPLVDLVGLTEREIAHAGRGVPEDQLQRGWIGHERNDTEFVLAQKPDLVIFNKWRATAWGPLDETRAGFWAEWLLLHEVKAGRAPYAVEDAELVPGVHWLMLRRLP